MFKIEEYSLGWLISHNGYFGRGWIEQRTGVKEVDKIFDKYTIFRDFFPTLEKAQATINEIESLMIMNKLIK